MSSRRRLPRSIWALGLVSMLMDISSEMIHSLLPVFLVVSLGASTMMVGLIEGIGEATASVFKLFSGWMSDRLGKRKALTVLGYSVSALTKPLFALAATPPWVLMARVSDRVGKGIRGAPRDALVGDLAPVDLRGRAYGLRQSLDTTGAIGGPLFAIVLMVLLDDVRGVFWLAMVPALGAVALLVFGVREPKHSPRGAHVGPPVHWDESRKLGGFFWAVVGLGAVITLARFSESFLILRAHASGLPIRFVPLVLVVMNSAYAATAYPAGALSDRVGRLTILAAACVTLIVADVILAFAPGIWTVMIGVGVWGLHMGLSQGLLVALVTDATSSELRGTALGFFHLASGAALLLASVVAGVLWDLAGPSATFMASAGFASGGFAGVWVLARWRAGRSQ